MMYSLSYGENAEKLKSFTKKELITDSTLNYFLDYEDEELVELTYSWLAEHRSETELAMFILERIEQNQEKYKGVAVKFLTEKVAADSLVQSKLIEIYLDPQTPADARSHMIILWWNTPLTDVVQCGLITGLIKYKTDFEEVLVLVSNQKNWSEQMYLRVAEAIREENNMKRKTELIRLLDSRKKDAPSEVKKYLKAVKKEMGM